MKNLLFFLGMVLCVFSSCEKDEERSSEKQILEFSISAFEANASGVIDEVAKTVTFHVPARTNVTKLTPMVKVSNLATVSPAVGSEVDFSKPVTYTVTAENGTTQEYVVTVVVAKSSECLINEFKFAGLDPQAFGVIDQEKKSIFVKVPFGTDITKLVPTIDLSIDATVEPNSEVATDFSAPVAYIVTAEDGTKCTYTVTVEVDVDPTALLIKSIKKTSLIAGLEDIVITGQNLKKVGTTSYIYIGTTKVKGIVNDEGTEISATVPSTTPVGDAKVKVQVGINNNSNELDVTIVENTFPNPEITGVNTVELVAGDELVINGSKFMKAGNKVRLVGTGYPATTYMLDVISENETTIKLSTQKIVKPGTYYLYIVSNGKETKYSTKISIKLKPAVITSVSPLKLKAGELITVTGENFNKETLSMILIDSGAHKITYVDDKHVTINASTDLTPGKYTLEIKIGATTASGAPTFKVIYSTEIEIVG